MSSHLRQIHEDVIDVEERLLSNHNDSEYRTYRQPRKRLSQVLHPLTLLNTLIMCASFIFMALGLRRGVSDSETVNDALRRLSTPSPVYDHVDFRLQSVSLNGSVLRTLNTTWNSGPEDEEKEALWNDLQHIRAIPLTGEQVKNMGKDPAKCAKLEDSAFHKGNDSYIGGLDIFHQARE
jgi:hypothetical protein